MDAEKLLAEADRRMYIEKQQHHQQRDARASAGGFGTLVQ
jgi:hypothetical protein